MPLYWVYLGTWGDLAEPGSDEEKRQLKMKEELDKLDGVRTADLDEARKCLEKAREIIRRHGYSPDFARISTQPECPECGHRGRFSDFFCAKCGVELTPSEDIR